ncbi:MAG: hypothetical protein V1909_02550, partial [Candidatus Micrarchaeota archaeon]
KSAIITDAAYLLIANLDPKSPFMRATSPIFQIQPKNDMITTYPLSIEQSALGDIKGGICSGGKPTGVFTFEARGNKIEIVARIDTPTVSLLKLKAITDEDGPRTLTFKLDYIRTGPITYIF